MKKTTLELPEPLLREVKMLAAQTGRKMKDLIADLLKAALAASGRKKPVRKLNLSEMPILKGGHKAKPGQQATPERIYEVLYGSGQ